MDCFVALSGFRADEWGERVEESAAGVNAESVLSECQTTSSDISPTSYLVETALGVSLRADVDVYCVFSPCMRNALLRHCDCRCDMSQRRP